MHRTAPVPAAVHQLAGLQAGLVTREQVLGCGFPPNAIDRLVRQGHWQRSARGIYTTTPARRDFEATAWLGLLAGGDQAILGGLAAGHRLGLVAQAPAPVPILVPQSCGGARVPGVRFERRRHLPTGHGVMPCPSPEWTVLELCALEPERLVEWVTTALRRRCTTTRRLRAALDERAQLPAGPKVRRRLELLLDEADGLESPLEHLFTTTVLRPHGLPHGERQVRRGADRHDVRLGPVLVELDGRLGHAGVAETFRDMARDNGAAVDGLLTLRYGHADCWHRPCETARQLDAVLRRLGLVSGAHPCPSCTAMPWNQTQ